MLLKFFKYLKINLINKNLKEVLKNKIQNNKDFTKLKEKILNHKLKIKISKISDLKN